MADIITEISLPSRGLLYDTKIVWQNRLKAPRLRDRGLADSTRKFKLQANILDNTIVEPLGMSAYDLHVADFIYLNMRQRQLSKGAAPYKVLVKCKNCGKLHKKDVSLQDLPITELLEKPKYELMTVDEKQIVFSFITPRILDESVVNALEFRKEYPEADLSDEDLKTQECLRFLIKTVDGKKLSYAQMTDFIQNMYQDDVEELLLKAREASWGVQFRQTFTCDSANCGKEVIFEVPIG